MMSEICKLVDISCCDTSFIQETSLNLLDNRVLDSLNVTDKISEIGRNNSERCSINKITSSQDIGSDSTNSFSSIESYEVENNINYHKQNYLQIEKEVNKYYYDEFDYYSSSLDILASYLKGQKIIYMEAKDYSQRKLNYLNYLHYI